jgi:hypothetical protein
MHVFDVFRKTETIQTLDYLLAARINDKHKILQNNRIGSDIGDMFVFSHS